MLSIEKRLVSILDYIAVVNYKLHDMKDCGLSDEDLSSIESLESDAVKLGLKAGDLYSKIMFGLEE